MWGLSMESMRCSRFSSCDTIDPHWAKAQKGPGSMCRGQAPLRFERNGRGWTRHPGARRAFRRRVTPWDVPGVSGDRMAQRLDVQQLLEAQCFGEENPGVSHEQLPKPPMQAASL